MPKINPARNIFEWHDLKWLPTFALDPKKFESFEELLERDLSQADALNIKWAHALSTMGLIKYEPEKRAFKILCDIPTLRSRFKTLEQDNGPNLIQRLKSRLLGLLGALALISGCASMPENYGRRNPRVEAMLYLDQAWNRNPAYYQQLIPSSPQWNRIQPRCYDSFGMVIACPSP